MQNTSLVAAGTIVGALAHQADAASKAVHTSRILNFNPEMTYRRLGKSNLMLSEVSLGGHSKNYEGGRFWGDFSDEIVPEDFAQNRTDVISACIDVGINYLDITTPAECLAYGVALKGRRDKMYVGADNYRLCPRDSERCTVEAQTFNVENCMRQLQTDYLDIWRPQMKMRGDNTDEEVEVVIETFEKLKQEGKVLHLGLSSHSRPWSEHILNNFPQFEMLIFPCSAQTKDRTQLPIGDNVEQVNAGSGVETSVFPLFLEKDVGLVTIKPFLGGSLYEGSNDAEPVVFPVMGVGTKTENDLARLTLQSILAQEAITATVPGLTTVYEVENAARASYTRPLGMTAADKQWLKEITERRWANLPAEYQWLRDWEYV